MACPDELTLDLWLADALPSGEAEQIAAHAGTCASCTAAIQLARGLDAELHSALALDAEELAYLSGLQLASTWRTRTASATLAWGWLALAGVVGSYAAWLVAAPTFGAALTAAAQVGLGTLVLNTALTVLFGFGQAVLELIRNPALGLSQPLLALFALVLLVWPRHLIFNRSTHV